MAFATVAGVRAPMSGSWLRTQVTWALVFTAVLGCDRREAAQSAAVRSAEPAQPTQVPARKLPRMAHSLIELIANPHQYQGADVGVVGYLVLNQVHEGEADGTLYLDRESARMMLNPNAVSVHFGGCSSTISTSDEKAMKADAETLPALPGYVVIRGIFEPRPESSVIGGGTICGVTSIVALEDPEQGKGATSWWNTVARPANSGRVSRDKAPGR